MDARRSAASRVSGRLSRYSRRTDKLCRKMIRAVIFDLDGTLADTEALHFVAFNEALKPEKIEIPRDEYYARLIGFNDHDCFAAVLSQHRKDADEALIADLTARKSVVYQQVLSERDVLYPGAEK